MSSTQPGACCAAPTPRGRDTEEQLYGGAPSGRTLTLLAAAYECDTEARSVVTERGDGTTVLELEVFSGTNRHVQSL